LRRSALAVLLAVMAPRAGAQSSTAGHRISAPISFYDDADPTERGMLSTSTSFSYVRVNAGRDIDGPSAYLSLGIHRRFDVSVDLARVNSTFEQTHTNSIGDSYIATKVLLLPEGRRRPALAVKPMLEVLGPASIRNDVLAPGRVNFVPSFIAQKSSDNYRFYYMGGYITRGILFQSLAGELNRWSRVTPTVILSTARVTRELKLISDLGLNRSRADASGGVTIMITKAWSLFVMGGRSFGREDLNTSRYNFSGGVAFNARIWGEQP